MKHSKIALTIITALGLSSISLSANAIDYNKIVKNPFLFCSAPKPCKACHPHREIYEDICVNKQPKQMQQIQEESNPPPKKYKNGVKQTNVRTVNAN